MTAVSLQVCSDCGTSYLEAPVCPHCGGGVFRFNWEEEEVPKINSGGVSHYSDTDPDHPYPQDEPVPAPRPRAAARAKNAAAEVKAAEEEASDGEGM